MSSEWQKAILQLDPHERMQRALDMRKESASNKQQKPMEIMDVNLDTVNRFICEFEAQVLIHGHVHKPGIHNVRTPQISAKRYVLGDWDGGSDGVIRVDDAGNISLYTP